MCADDVLRDSDRADEYAVIDPELVQGDEDADRGVDTCPEIAAMAIHDPHAESEQQELCAICAEVAEDCPFGFGECPRV